MTAGSEAHVTARAVTPGVPSTVVIEAGLLCLGLCCFFGPAVGPLAGPLEEKEGSQRKSGRG